MPIPTAFLNSAFFHAKLLSPEWQTITSGFDPMPEPKVASLERGIQILLTFLNGDDALTLTQIAERTGNYKSTSLRLCCSLEAVGCLRRRDDNTYVLGPAIGELAEHFRRANLIDKEIIYPVMTKLSQDLNETVAYYIPTGDQQTCIFRVHSASPLRVHISEGFRAPITQGASGIVLQAFQGRQGEKFDKVREDKLAYSRGEIFPGAAGIAAPVFDGNGRIAGSMAVVGPQDRFGPTALIRMKQRLKAACQDISRKMPKRGVDIGTMPQRPKRPAKQTQKPAARG
jgi:DNA-binding IclR family transcriptional regulator